MSPPTDKKWVDRFVWALERLCGRRPPQKIWKTWFRNSQSAETALALQSWVGQQDIPHSVLTIDIIDAAKLIANAAANMSPLTDLEQQQRRYEGCTCRVGTPQGPGATVERVYQARGMVAGVYKCKVIMFDTGRVRYFDIAEVYL